MTLESQVVSLPLAKRLKELGMKQEALYYWTECVDDYDVPPALRATYKEIPKDSSGTYGDGKRWSEAKFAAFTVAELGEMLPVIVEGLIGNVALLSGKHRDTAWWIRYQNTAQEQFLYQQEADTEADARAKMLVYLIENDLMSV